MEQLHFSIRINAPKRKVWDTMLSDKTYREWTAVFGNGSSSFQGNWEKGSTMRFIGTDENGKEGGVESKVVENKPYEFIALEHKGVIEDGALSDKPEYKAWVGAHENYSFKEVDGVTELRVDTDADEYTKADFQKQWPEALQKLKDLSEQS